MGPTEPDDEADATADGPDDVVDAELVDELDDPGEREEPEESAADIRSQIENADTEPEAEEPNADSEPSRAPPSGTSRPPTSCGSPIPITTSTSPTCSSSEQPPGDAPAATGSRL